MKWFVEKWRLALIVIGIVLVPFIVWKVPEWQVRAYHGRLDTNAISRLTPQELIQLQKDLITAENNARVALAQIIGGLVVLLGLYATFKNVKIAQDNHRVALDNYRVALDNLRVTEEGKLTERFSKSVEHLGSDKLDVRLGGIYALERIARDSQKDHWTVIEVLTAFVREQSRKERDGTWQKYLDDCGKASPGELPAYKYPADIQAALTVIGRREWVEQETQHQRIDLSKSFLKGTDLRRAHLGGASLYEADLRGANLLDADLRRAYFGDADLREAHFRNADLSEAHLIGANLSGAYLVGTNLSETRLNGADLSGAYLNGANLNEADFSNVNLCGASLIKAREFTWEQFSQLSVGGIDEKTKLPPKIEERFKTEREKEGKIWDSLSTEGIQEEQ